MNETHRNTIVLHGYSRGRRILTCSAGTLRARPRTNYVTSLEGRRRSTVDGHCKPVQLLSVAFRRRWLVFTNRVIAETVFRILKGAFTNDSGRRLVGKTDRNRQTPTGEWESYLSMALYRFSWISSPNPKGPPDKKPAVPDPKNHFVLLNGELLPVTAINPPFHTSN